MLARREKAGLLNWQNFIESCQGAERNPWIVVGIDPVADICRGLKRRAEPRGGRASGGKAVYVDSHREPYPPFTPAVSSSYGLGHGTYREQRGS